MDVSGHGQFEVLTCNLPKGLRKFMKHLLRICDLWNTIWTWDVPHLKQVCLLINPEVWYGSVNP